MLVTAPRIDPVPAGVKRPLWSIMIPTFNCAKYLRRTLASVLAQDAGEDLMQIEVVDDCSTKDDPAAVVREMAPGRVDFTRNEENLGATRNFNQCIRRARGELVHMLHGDDLVAPNFYTEIGGIASSFPECSFFATRAFFIDENDIVLFVTERLDAMEAPTRDVTRMLANQLFQTPGVVVRRRFYEEYGGFRPELVHCADWEMWVRAVHFGGGVVHSQPLASYRVFGASDTSRLALSGENVRDILRLAGAFAGYQGFSPAALRVFAARRAFEQYRRFAAAGNDAAAAANRSLYESIVPRRERFAGRAIGAMRSLFHYVAPETALWASPPR